MFTDTLSLYTEELILVEKNLRSIFTSDASLLP